jgi:hypothetical protein
MTIKELIAKLELVKADHGDQVEVTIGNVHSSWISDVDTVEVNTYETENLGKANRFLVLTPHEEAVDAHGTGGDLDEPEFTTSYHV